MPNGWKGKGFTYTNSRGRIYYLHARETTLKSGKQQTIYFFAKEEKEGSIDAVPAGYVVVGSLKISAPYLCYASVIM